MEGKGAGRGYKVGVNGGQAGGYNWGQGCCQPRPGWLLLMLLSNPQSQSGLHSGVVDDEMDVMSVPPNVPNCPNSLSLP